jgi:hypothetical protein
MEAELHMQQQHSSGQTSNSVTPNAVSLPSQEQEEDDEGAGSNVDDAVESERQPNSLSSASLSEDGHAHQENETGNGPAVVSATESVVAEQNGATDRKESGAAAAATTAANEGSAAGADSANADSADQNGSDNDKDDDEDEGEDTLIRLCADASVAAESEGQGL